MSEVNNIHNNNIFASSKKLAKMSYRVDDISFDSNSEILKLKLKGGFLCRIMKFIDTETSQPALIYDLVDEEKEAIMFKSDEIFINAVGISTSMVINYLISQWEVVPTDKLCRSFLVGDKVALLETLDEFNIKMSRSADWYIRNEMD